MKLYQINQSSYPATVENDWQQSLTAGDAVFFFESGILRAVQEKNTIDALNQRGILVFYRQRDLEGYGIKPMVGHGISDNEWVALTARSHSIVSW